MPRTRSQARGFLFADLSQERWLQQQEALGYSHNVDNTFDENPIDNELSFYYEPTEQIPSQESNGMCEECQGNGHYGQRDTCKRHRKPDDQEKVVYVPAHYRRKQL